MDRGPFFRCVCVCAPQPCMLWAAVLLGLLKGCGHGESSQVVNGVEVEEVGETMRLARIPNASVTETFRISFSSFRLMSPQFQFANSTPKARQNGAMVLVMWLRIMQVASHHAGDFSKTDDEFW